MKHRAAVIVCTAMVLNLTACSGQGETIKQERETSTENFAAESETVHVKESELLFPASCTEGTEKVKFDCDLEIPKGFDAENFYIPEVFGLQYIDGEAAYGVYVEGMEIADEYHYETDDKNIATEDYYILQDGSQVGIAQGINYVRPEVSTYMYVMRDSEAGASQDNFSFGTGEDSVSQVREALANLDFPVEEYQFSWFSMSGAEHMEMEEEKLKQGVIGEESMRTDWTKLEGEYEIYAWQIYGGLQVFPPIMTRGMNLAFETYQRAPVQSIVSDQGMLSLYGEAPYAIEQTEELASFLPFSEIVTAVEERYGHLLTDEDVSYTVKRAKLAVRICMDEAGEYAAEPVWYFEVQDSAGSTEVLLFHALTGKEIFLT